MARVKQVFLQIIVVNILQPILSFRTQSEFGLHKMLLEEYNPNIIPRDNIEPVIVNITFYLIALLRFDEKEETLTSASWLSMSWEDRFLTWTEKPDFENFTEIFMQQKQIWRPDIMLINTVEHYRNLGSDDHLVSVEQNGMVTWEPGHKFKTACSVNIKMYPFDNQECKLIFSTWMHVDDMVIISSESDRIMLDAFEENGEWEIVSSKAVDGIIQEYDYSISEFVVTLTLRRRRMYYVLTVCIPIIVLSILNCMVFILPPDSGEKISFCLTILLAYMVYMSFLSDNLPRTSKTLSHLVVYLSLMICLSFLSVFNSVIVLLFWHKPDQNVDDTKQGEHLETAVDTLPEKLENSLHINFVSNGTLNEVHNTVDEHVATKRKSKISMTSTRQLSRRLDKIMFICMCLLTIIITGIIIILLLFA